MKMGDITKCDGANCPKRDICRRYTYPASYPMQSWMASKDCIESEYGLYWPHHNSGTLATQGFDNQAFQKPL